MIGNLLQRLRSLLGAKAPAETVDLFVLAGQSNMEGTKGEGAFYPVDAEGLDAGIRFYWSIPNEWNSGHDWVAMGVQEGRFETGHFGPEVTFARSLRKAGYNPAIFKYSQCNTSLAEHWLAPGSRGMYDAMMVELHHAVGLLRKRGLGVRIRALVWLQGESDAIRLESAQVYGKRLELLLEDFRKQLDGGERVLALLGVDEQHPYIQRLPQVLVFQKRIAAADRRNAFTSMEGLEKADLTHLLPGSIEAHGVRLFQDYCDLLRRQPANS